jgi:hypothetical protein
MQRLRDQRGSSDPTVARAAELLSARKPLAPDAERKVRVRARLRRRRTLPRGAMVLRWAMLILMTCSVAAASAMIGKVATAIRVLRAERREEAAHERVHRRVTRTHATPPTSTAVVSTPLPLPVPSPSPITSTPTTTSTPATTTTPTKTSTPMKTATPAVAMPKPTDAPSEEQVLLTSAVRALRHEHDPARATELLGRYLDRHPDGVAVEDALALALEATIARDPPRAAGFATRYLAHYPSGRWSALARRALEP